MVGSPGGIAAIGRDSGDGTDDGPFRLRRRRGRSLSTILLGTTAEDATAIKNSLIAQEFDQVATLLNPIRNPDERAKLLTARSEKNPEKMVLQEILDDEEQKIKTSEDKEECLKDDPKRYTLFKSHNSWTYIDYTEKHLLSIIAQSQSTELIHHNYVQAYIRAYWESHKWKYQLWLSNICYIMMLICTTISTIWICHATSHGWLTKMNNTNSSTHENNTDNSNSSNSSQNTSSHTVPSTGVQIALELICILSSLVLLFVEYLQLRGSGIFYFRSKTNIFELICPILAIIVCSFNTFSDTCFSYGLLIFQVIALIIMWMSGAWKLAIIPHIPPKAAPCYQPGTSTWIRFIKECQYSLYTVWLNVLKETSISFMMFFEILKTVVWTFPVILYFCLLIGIAFIVVIGPQRGNNTQNGFMNTGHSTMTLLVMSIGELEYADLYHGDDSPFKTETMYAFGYILLLFLLMCLPITGMNLLIGKAIFDVNKIKDKCEALVFQHLVDAIVQYEGMRRYTLCRGWQRKRSDSQTDGNRHDSNVTFASYTINNTNHVAKTRSPSILMTEEKQIRKQSDPNYNKTTLTFIDEDKASQQISETEIIEDAVVMNSLQLKSPVVDLKNHIPHHHADNNTASSDMLDEADEARDKINSDVPSKNKDNHEDRCFFCGQVLSSRTKADGISDSMLSLNKVMMFDGVKSHEESES